MSEENVPVAIAEPSEDQPAPDPSRPPRTRAIVYVPHLGHTDGHSISDFATRLAAVLDGDDPARPATYSVEDTAEAVHFGRTAKKAVAPGVTVVREEGAQESAIGIYEFSYSTHFTQRFDRRSSLLKTLSLLRAVGLNLGRLTGDLARGRDPGLKNALAWGVRLNLVLCAAAIAYLVLDTKVEHPAYAGVLTGLVALSLVGIWKLKKRLTAGAAAAPAGGGGHEARDHDRRNSALAAGAAVAGAWLVGEVRGGWLVPGRILLGLGVVLLMSVWMALGNPDLRHRVQIAIGFVLLMLMTSYAFLLIAAALAEGWTVIDGVQDGTGDFIANALSGLAVGLTALGVTVSPKELRAQVNNGATQLLGAIRYLSEGEGRDPETGRFYALVEHLAEAGYTAVDVVGYSFGSILALDALYPAERPHVPEGTRQLVKRLVTIGSPVVTVATFWPDYWKGRRPWGGRWINVYSPRDVLSSYLCPAPAEAQARVAEESLGTEGPRPKEEWSFGPDDDLTPWKRLALSGLRAHSKYWETPYDHDHGAIACLGYLWSGPNWEGSPSPPEAVCPQPEETPNAPGGGDDV